MFKKNKKVSAFKKKKNWIGRTLTMHGWHMPVGLRGNGRSKYLYLLTEFLPQKRCFVGVCFVMCNYTSEKSTKRDCRRYLFNDVDISSSLLNSSL